MISAELLTICRRQHGVVTARQLREELGFDRSSLYRARRSGVLVPMTAHTYRVASTPDSFTARCAAAQLHCGVGFLAADTAGRLRGLRRMSTHPVRYVVPSDVRTTLPNWVYLHRTTWYGGPRDRVRLDDGLVVATPERMLFGIAARSNQYRFERAAEDAWHLELTDPTTMAAYLEAHRCRGKDGVSRIEAWLDKALLQERPLQSGLEQTIAEAVEMSGLPAPRRQHPLTLLDGETIHLDISWPDIRFAVEPGASWWHGGDEQVRKDQLRDLSCAEIGWVVLRIDDRLAAEPRAIARRIRRAYHARARELRATAAEPPDRR